MENNSIKPAFPFPDPEQGNAFYHQGLTKREYFAGLALQSLITKTQLIDRADGSTQEDVNKHRTDVCESAILYADELLRQLNQE